MAAELPPPYLLLVDDSDEDMFLFKRLVQRTGITLPCQSATGVAPAIALLNAAMQGDLGGRPRGCFVDIKMPGQNGFDLLAWIRGQPLLATMPVIMLSSSDEPADLARARELGAQCYLTKYPSTKTLVEVIADLERFADNPAALDQPYNLLRNVVRATARIDVPSSAPRRSVSSESPRVT
jgi:CheY-like chemotaxis protein